MEDNIENEYVVTDENGCATDPSIFGEWEYSPETNSLLASFNAFKFPSSNNIRFQCNIRVCFGRCQPVNCRGYNAFGKRRRRAIDDTNSSSTGVALPKDDGIEGQLREEITISSNAILTFEKKDERFAADGSESKFLTISYPLLWTAYIHTKKKLLLFLISSSSGCPKSGRYLRIDDWFNHSLSNNSIVGIGSCCSCSIMLVDGIQKTTKGNRTSATSARYFF